MLQRLISRNWTRADLAEKLQELIESYNAGSRNIEELFEELLKLSRKLRPILSEDILPTAFPPGRTTA